MNFPLITIPDPAAVGEWLDEEVPAIDPHRVNRLHGGSLITIAPPKTIEDLTVEADAAARTLAEAVQATYPVGSTIRAKLHGRETWITATVEGYACSLRYPHELRVRNLRTGKCRNISAHPQHGNSVGLVTLPENSHAHPPR